MIESAAMLNDRALLLLKTLVERYISDGQPVGSRTLLQHSGLELSSATIRNVLADLENHGLVSSPHHSAGRIPTESAYRLFIDTMLVSQPLEQAVVAQCAAQLQPAQPSRLALQASRLLSELTHFTGLVATPRRVSLTIRQVEFLRLAERRVLLIIVLPSGEVENRVLQLPRDYSQAQLTEAGNYLNQHFAGRSLGQMRKQLHQELQQLHQDLNALMSAALAAGEALEDELAQDCVISGKHHLLEVEDLSGDMGRLRGLFNLFEQKTDLLHLLEAGQQGAGVRIFVGAESGVESLLQCSVIAAPYSADGQVVGTLAVVGPKRMDYQHVVSVVDMTARLLSNSLSSV